MKISIGQAALHQRGSVPREGHNVAIDLDLLLRTRLLIQANSGGGKSFLLRRLAEQLFGHTQVIIIDPEGEFSTLREKFGYVLVGKGGETPADVRSAEMLAHKLLELRASAVCDLFEMKSTERHHWVRLFLEAMIDAPKRLWHPAVVIVDEAHQFAPEKGAGESEASEAMISLATRGRKRGYAAVFATQRLGKLRKDAAAELLNVMVGQTFIDIDRKRAAECLGVAGHNVSEFFDAIKIIEPGYFFALGRAICLERTLLKVGVVQTTHPEPGSSKHAAEPPPPPEKVRELLPKLADLPKAAEEAARTVAEFKAEIRSLKAQLRSVPVAPKEVKVSDQGEIKRLRAEFQKHLDESHKRQVQMYQAIGETSRALELAQQRLNRTLEHQEPITTKLRADVVRTPPPAANYHPDAVRTLPVAHNIPANAPRTPSNGEPSDLTPKQREILKALWEFQRLGRTPTHRSWVAARAEMSAGGGTFNNYVSNLRTRGLIEYSGGGAMRLTEEGKNAAPQSDDVLTQEALLESCMRLLTPKQQDMLKALVQAYPNAMSNEELATAAGMTAAGGTFNNYRSTLRTSGMIEYQGGGSIAASWLFVD